MSDREAEALADAERRVASVLGGAQPVNVADDGLDAWYWAFRLIQAYEAWQCHGAWIEARDPKMTPGVRERFEFGRDLAISDVEDATAKRARMRGRLEDLLGSDGVLVLPTVPSIAPKRDAAGEDLQAFRERALAILCISGNSSLPQVSLPLAVLDDCPLGLSLIGPRGSDRALVSLAVAIAENG
jgi:amidase